MIRASALPSSSAVERIPAVAAWARPFAPTARSEAPRSGGAASDSRLGIVAGLLAKRDDSPGVLIVANGARTSSPCIFRDSAGTFVEFDLGDLVHTTVAVFRRHPHINNVMTHICAGQWERIGQALRLIFNPLATLNDLSALAQNIVELMCAERGITGRILKPYFHASLARVLPPRTAEYLRRHILRLFLKMKARDAHRAQGASESRARRAAEAGA